MPNSFKFNSSTIESLSLRKGNIYIGVGDVGKGPTSLTGFKASPSFGTASSLIGLHRGEGVFSWYRNFSDSELISRTNRIDTSNVRTTKEECFSYFGEQLDKIVLNREYESIVTNGLVLNLDAGFLPSYPTTNTSWYDLSGNQPEGTLVNGPTFSTDGGGSIVFDGSNDFCQINGSGNLNFGVNDNFTIEIWFNLLSIPPSGNTSALCCKSNCVGIDWYFPSPGGIKVRVGIRNTPNGQQSFESNQNMNLNRWYQVIFTFFPNQSDGIKIFINGVLDRSASNVGFSEFSDVTKNFIIAGNSALGGTPTHTNINKSRVLMYNRALSASEILQNYNATKDRYITTTTTTTSTTTIGGGGQDPGEEGGEKY